MRHLSTRAWQEPLISINKCSSCLVFTDNYAVEGLSLDIKLKPGFENIVAKA